MSHNMIIYAAALSLGIAPVTASNKAASLSVSKTQASVQAANPQNSYSINSPQGHAMHMQMMQMQQAQMNFQKQQASLAALPKAKPLSTKDK